MESRKKCTETLNSMGTKERDPTRTNIVPFLMNTIFYIIIIVRTHLIEMISIISPVPSEH